MSDKCMGLWPTPQARMPGHSAAKIGNLLTGNRHSFYLTHAVAADQIQPGIITAGAPQSHSNQLTLFAEAFPASPTPWLVNAADLPTTATSGPTSLDSFASVNPDGSWRKTCQGYSQATLDGSLEGFSETWPRAGMTRNGIAYRRAPLAPLTGGTASGWLPTPTDASKGGGSSRSGDRINETPTLQGMARKGLWPTPDARDANPEGFAAGLRRREKYSTWGLQTAAQFWPTPCAEDAKNVPYQKGKDGLTRYPMLLGAVDPARMWPTPSSRDWKDSPGMARTGTNPDGSTRTRDDQLARRVYSTPTARDAGTLANVSRGRGSSAKGNELIPPLAVQVGGTLNPTWVEWLMGYPLEWTVCAPSATASSRRSRSGSRGASSRRK